MRRFEFQEVPTIFLGPLLNLDIFLKVKIIELIINYE